MPHGRAWKILNKELLMKSVIPAYFAQSKFNSFTRQLNSWDFKRLHQKGADFGCYYHEKFLRGLPALTVLMVRLNAKQGKPLPYAKGEPDFYKICKFYPLPPLPMKVFDQDSSSPSLAKPTKPRAVMTPTSHLVPHHNVIPKFDLSSTQSQTTAPPAHVDSSTRCSMTADTMSDGMHPLSSSIPLPFAPSIQSDQHPTILPAHKTSGTTSPTSAVAPFAKVKCLSSHRVPTAINVQNLITCRAAQETPRSSAQAREWLTSVSAMASAPELSAQTLHPPPYSHQTQNATDPAIFLATPMATPLSRSNYRGATGKTQAVRISLSGGQNSRSRAGCFTPDPLKTLSNNLHNPQQENDRVQHNVSPHRSCSSSIATSYSNRQQHDGECQHLSMFHQSESTTLNPNQWDRSGNPGGSYEGESDFDDDMNRFLAKNGI